MNKNILEQILLLSEVAEITNTTESNILDLIKRERIPHCYYKYRKASNKKLGTYVFNRDFIKYYNDNLKKK